MITQHRDLRTGVSYWQSSPDPGLPTEELSRDIQTDVLVIGAGISGAVIAERLSQDHAVVVVDRRGPAMGSTLASTALIDYEIDTPLTHLARAIGAGDAARAWLRSYRALHALAKRADALGIDCRMRRRDSLYLCGNLLDADEICSEGEARRAIGLKVEFLSRPQLASRFGIDREGALFSLGGLTVDPRLMAIEYLRVAESRGARVFAPVDVTAIECSSGGITAATDGGPAVRAMHAVLATGYELPPFLPAKGQRVVSTYAIATKPQPDRLWPERPLVWEAAEPYLYMRTTEDGRVICGGEDEDIADATARDALIASRAEAISAKLGRLFPQLDPTAVFAWAGAFGTTQTGLPLIGEIPQFGNCWGMFGFGGNGMTYCDIGADIIAAAIAGRVDPDADLFAFNAARWPQSGM